MHQTIIRNIQNGNDWINKNKESIGKTNTLKKCKTKTKNKFIARYSASETWCIITEHANIQRESCISFETMYLSLYICMMNKIHRIHILHIITIINITQTNPRNPHKPNDGHNPHNPHNHIIYRYIIHIYIYICACALLGEDVWWWLVWCLVPLVGV